MQQRFIVPEESDRVRVDTFLTAQLTQYSRSFIQKLLKSGAVKANGVVVRPSVEVKHGMELMVTIPEVKKHVIALPILYEDADVLVMNKPAGMLTHSKGVISNEATVADFVREHTTDNVDSNRPGIVHRLDRDTSGIIIAAKHSEAREFLQKAFSDRTVQKRYIALVEGRLTPEEAVLKLPIERSPKQPQLFRVGGAGKYAETYYEVIETYDDDYTLVSLHPKTGRTHQLRVHMQYVGRPIVGDAFYGTLRKDVRLFLHASELELTLPNGQHEIFQAPLADDLQQFLEGI